MKNIKIRVEGIYDLRTIAFLKNLNIKSYSFDFRPRSFNFLQQYKFFEILSQEYSKNSFYFLKYENERDFIIQKMLDDLLEFSIKNNLWSKLEEMDNARATTIDNFCATTFPLEFSDDLGRKYYDSFKHPYWWHYRESNELNLLLESPYLQGIIVESDLFGQYFNQEAIFGFLQLFYIRNSNVQTPLKLIIRTQLPNIKILLSNFNNDYVKMEFLSLPIDQSIEVCYRNVDLKKLNQSINWIIEK
ncbi:MAG: hypothetical protein HQK51_11915 [Oligoflexia bacterium]|nr:hypothetical protein [Oligoflexia bacterium]